MREYFAARIERLAPRGIRQAGFVDARGDLRYNYVPVSFAEDCVMTRTVVATIFVLASLTAPAMAIDVGYDCVEGADEEIVTPQQTPIPPHPVPAPGS